MKPKAYGWVFPGEFLQKFRLPHLIGIIAYGGLGLFTMILESWTGLLTGLAVLVSLYFLILLTGRVLAVRGASNPVRRSILLDFFDMTVLSGALAFISSFWFGFGAEVLGSYSDVPQTHMMLGFMFSGVASVAFLSMIATGVVTLVDRAVQDGEHR